MRRTIPRLNPSTKHTRPNSDCGSVPASSALTSTGRSGCRTSRAVSVSTSGTHSTHTLRPSTLSCHIPSTDDPAGATWWPRSSSRAATRYAATRGSSQTGMPAGIDSDVSAVAHAGWSAITGSCAPAGADTDAPGIARSNGSRAQTRCLVTVTLSRDPAQAPGACANACTTPTSTRAAVHNRSPIDRIAIDRTSRPAAASGTSACCRRPNASAAPKAGRSISATTSACAGGPRRPMAGAMRFQSSW